MSTVGSLLILASALMAGLGLAQLARGFPFSRRVADEAPLLDRCHAALLPLLIASLLFLLAQGPLAASTVSRLIGCFLLAVAALTAMSRPRRYLTPTALAVASLLALYASNVLEP